MAGKVLEIESILTKDSLACDIGRNYQTWESARNIKVAEWKEIQQYIFATDTTKTSNSKLPWSNKTTIPKLCQIRDNLYANYIAAMFPKQNWLEWQGEGITDENREKKEAIESYMLWAIDRNEFYDEMAKVVYDYIDYGNCFVMPEWIDRTQVANGTKIGFVGPGIRRISPLDIVFNPTSPTFTDSPKIIRSVVSIGEVKSMIESGSIPADQKESALKLYDYMVGVRKQVATWNGSSETRDNLFQLAGFQDFQNYLGSNYVELLTFYGDAYDPDSDTMFRNYEIKVVDRHRVLCKQPNPSYFGTAPIYHAGWRTRPDNLWAMGPLDNLVGMQYRIDHIENMKADIFDLTRFPVLKVKGYVEDFDWGPGERIYTGDAGDVSLLNVETNILSSNSEIAVLEQRMEEMAGSPKEAAGFRTPGEKTKYEVQRLEMAAGRIFQNKIQQFERAVVENALNAMLELARRNVDVSVIRIFDTEFKLANFKTLTAEDITGAGRIKPVAARHFAEQANKVQNLNAFFNSAAGQDPEVRQHFSSVKLAKLFEALLEIESDKIVLPFVRISEQSDAAKMTAAAQQDVHMSTTTATGFRPGDSDPGVGDA